MEEPKDDATRLAQMDEFIDQRMPFLRKQLEYENARAGIAEAVVRRMEADLKLMRFQSELDELKKQRTEEKKGDKNESTKE
jgi:hypothetical protein